MMSKEEVKKKIEAELAVAQEKLAELKKLAKDASADARGKYAKQADALEEKIDAAKAKLGELGEASEEAWEKIKGSVESAWGSLSDSVRDAVSKLKKK